MEKEDNRRVWLGITYTVPAKPSRARVYIWRKLKELGAEYYHGMAMVPQTPRLQESIKKLVARIRELGAEGTPCLRVYNKSDLFWGDIRPHGEDAVNISAKTGEGVDELLEVLGGWLPEGPQLFPDGAVTDQPERQIMAEIVREKLLRELDQEIPHGTAVEVTQFSQRDDTDIIDCHVTIYCEKASHKGIIIGKGGAMLKKISTQARKDMEAFMGAKVYLETWVKVKENWRDNPAAIQNFGYTED